MPHKYNKLRSTVPVGIVLHLITSVTKTHLPDTKSPNYASLICRCTRYTIIHHLGFISGSLDYMFYNL